MAPCWYSGVSGSAVFHCVVVLIRNSEGDQCQCPHLGDGNQCVVVMGEVWRWVESSGTTRETFFHSISQKVEANSLELKGSQNTWKCLICGLGNIHKCSKWLMSWGLLILQEPLQAQGFPCLTSAPCNTHLCRCCCGTHNSAALCTPCLNAHHCLCNGTRTEIGICLY